MSVVATLRYLGDRADTPDDETDPDACYNDMYYMGKGIPSRSFQLLQDAVGNDEHAVAMERRRRRRNEYLRQRSKSQEALVPVQTGDFDEDAYLTEGLPVKVTEDRTPRAKSAERKPEKAPWQKAEADENAPSQNGFNEEAYLAGRTPVINSEPKQPFKPLPSELVPQEETGRASPTDQKQFDEDAYLAGQANLLGGEAKPRTVAVPLVNDSETPRDPADNTNDREKSRDFDEEAFFAGKLNLLGNESQTDRPIQNEEKEDETPEWAKKRQNKLTKQASLGCAPEIERLEARYLESQAPPVSDPDTPADNEKSRDFDEEAFFAGKLNLLGNEAQSDKPIKNEEKQDETPEWAKQRQNKLTKQASLGGAIEIERLEARYLESQAPPVSDPDTPADDEKSRDFDEEAFFAGKLNLLGNEAQSDRPIKNEEKQEETPEWAKKRQNKLTEQESLGGATAIERFEASYLKSQAPPVSDPDTPADDEKSRDFDEEAFFAGKLNILGNEAQSDRPIKNDEKQDETPEWAKKRQNKLTEQSSLGGAPEIERLEARYLESQAPPVSDPDTQADEEKSRDFDEEAFIAGKLNLLGNESQTDRPIQNAKKQDETPEWAKKRQHKLIKQASRDGPTEIERFEASYLQSQESKKPEEADDNTKEPFDENAFLEGKVAIVGGGSNLPPRAPKAQPGDPRPAWQKSDDHNTVDEGFDEDAFLRGKVPVLRNSVDRELPPREYAKKKPSRERASWERPGEDDTQLPPGGEFDESRYLAGRVPTSARRSVDRDVSSPATNGSAPARTVHYLRRSMSREISPSSSVSSGRPPSRQSSCSYDSGDEDQDPNKVITDMQYQGRHIPSKTFLRLKKSIASRNCKERKKSADVNADNPIENLRIKSLDMENLQIDSHDPNQYLEQLKESVHASNNIKIEADSNEITDF